METLKVALIGKRPLLMNCDELADPLNENAKYFKSLNGKRKKTQEDHEDIAKISWLGSLYCDEVGPFITGLMVEASLIGGGRLKSKGKEFERGCEVMDEKCYLIYDGPKTPEELWKEGFYDVRNVKVGGKRIPRYRPIFTRWEAQAQIMFDPKITSEDQIIASFSDAGDYIGIGDFRPKFGRYKIEVL